MKCLVSRVRAFLTDNFVWLGLGSLLWLLLRSGTRPSRLSYPCQRAAAGAGVGFLGLFVVPALLRLARSLRAGLPRFRLDRNLLTAATAAGLVAAAIFLAPRPPGRAPMPAAAALPSWTSADSALSHIFVVDSFPVYDTTRLYHEGLDSLLSLMARNGLCFYRSSRHLPWCDTNGLIAADDVVLLKVNAEWDQRGQTNGDVIKGVIARIVDHPDSFTGEVHLVENGHWRHSWTYYHNNAEDTRQTMQSIVDRFAAMGHRVGACNWTAFGYGGANRWVEEYDQGDTATGYVKEDSTGMTYPKFTSEYGTRISVHRGIWDGAGYDPGRLKLINIPVLKSHQLMGVTASVKHYIGFLSYAHTGYAVMHEQTRAGGLLGVELGKARFPTLNLIDATWVMAEIVTGPGSPYTLATRRNALIASQDPVAGDYYAGRYLLRPMSWWQGRPWLRDYNRMDPDNQNSENPGLGNNYSDSTPCFGMPYNAFHQMLASSMELLLVYGRNVTMDTARMSVHLFRFPPGIGEEGARPPHLRPALSVGRVPATGSVTVRYSVPVRCRVGISIHDAGGRLVRRLVDRPESTGEHRLVWDRTDADGRAVSSGSYLVVADIGDEQLSCKVVLTGR